MDFFKRKIENLEEKEPINQEIEAPVPNDGKARKQSFTTKIVYENGEFKVRKVTKFKVYEVDFHKWIREKPDLVEMLPLESLGLQAPKKEVSIPVIILKPIVDPETSELTEGYFLYEANYKVSPEYSAVYLNVTRNIVVQTHLINGQSFPLPVFESIKGVNVTLSQKPQRITKAEALSMEKQGVHIFNKEKDEYKHFIKHD